MEFRILGPLEVSDDGRVLPLAGTRQRALLAVLLLNANAVVSGDRLLDELWGDALPESGLAALQVRISQLRKALGPGGAKLETRPTGYLLRLDRGELDLSRFTELVEEARDHDNDIRRAAELLHSALALWRGDALADLAFEPFARAAVGRLQELRVATLERRVELDLALGRHAELVGELETLVDAHPFREHLRAQLMLALYRSGRQVEALDLYQRTRKTLVDELGIEPSVALQELERAILRHDRELDVSVPPVPGRAVLVGIRDPSRLEPLLALARELARRPPKELVLAWAVESQDDLAQAVQVVHDRREALRAAGLAARAAAFVSSAAGADLVRLAVDQDVDLVLVDGTSDPLADSVLATLLDEAPCDVAVVVGAAPRPGPVLVPFVGAAHDWAAVELGAWIAQSTGVSLILAGTTGDPAVGRRDASRLLASASLAVQRALGVAAEPLLLAAGTHAIVEAASAAGVVVVGLPDRWPRDGLGTVRQALAEITGPATVLVRRGIRPGGLVPDRDLSRFTWSISPG